jgi:hypothetical protein
MVSINDADIGEIEKQDFDGWKVLYIDSYRMKSIRLCTRENGMISFNLD